MSSSPRHRQRVHTTVLKETGVSATCWQKGFGLSLREGAYLAQDWVLYLPASKQEAVLRGEPCQRHQAGCPREPQKAVSVPPLRGQEPHLWSKAGEVLQVAADAIGFLDDGVDVQLGDLLHQAVFIALSVLED